MSKTIIQTPCLMQPIAHFSHAQVVGASVYVGAIAGTDPQRRLAGDAVGVQDTPAQVRRMMDNLRTTLGLAGGSLEDLVRLKLYVNDARDASCCEEMVRALLPRGGVVPSVCISHGFPLAQAAAELDALAELGAEKEQIVTQSGAAVRCGPKLFGFVGLGADLRASTMPGGGELAEALRTALLELLSRARLALAQVVHLRVTLAHECDIAALDEAVGRLFCAPYPACSVIVAPLSHPRQRFLVEIVATEGAGIPIGIAGAANALRNASTAMLAGDELYVSAQTGTVPGEAPDDAESQALRAWERIREVLRKADMDARHIVLTSNTLTDWRHYADFNAGYGASITSPFPPRSTLFGRLRDPRAVVQTEAVAHGRALSGTVVEASGHASA